MVLLILLFLLLFALLLLATPIVVTANARLSPAGGAVFLVLHLFGAIPVPLRLRLHLLSPPYLTLSVFGRALPLLSPKKRRPPDPRAIRPERIDLCLTLGLWDDPARTVQMLGALDVLLSMLLTRLAPHGSVAARPSFSDPMLRVSVRAVALVFPLFLLIGRPARIEKRPAGNPNRRTKQEKRCSHVPC